MNATQRSRWVWVRFSRELTTTTKAETPIKGGTLKRRHRIEQGEYRSDRRDEDGS